MKQQALGLTYKKRVIPIPMGDFRKLFSLDETRDPKTGKVLQPTIYENYKDIRKQNGLTYSLVVTEQNYTNYWRIVATITAVNVPDDLV